MSLSFDPYKHPTSAALLRRQSVNDDASLSPKDIALHEALETYQDIALPLYQKVANGDTEKLESLLLALNQLQQVYMDLGYWQEALEMEQDKCQHLFQNVESDDHADSIHAQGKLHVRIATDTAGDNAQHYHGTTARRLYEQAIAHYQCTSNDIQHGHVGISMAGWHFLLHQDYDAALDCLQQAETTFLEVLLKQQESGDDDSRQHVLLLYTLLVKCFDNQGLIYRLRGDFSTALEKYQKAMGVMDHVDEKEGTGGEIGSAENGERRQLAHLRRAMQMHVGDMYMALEDSDRALDAYQALLRDIQTEQIDNESTELSSMEGVLWHNIAAIHVDHGDYDLALQEFRKSIDAKERASANDGTTANQSSYHPELAQTWNMMGGLLAGIFEETGQALECFQKALMIARINASSNNVDPQHDPDVLSALQNIAVMEQELKRRHRANKNS
jgi:tetratricopeptide (TPR) repeat protein